MTRNERIRGTTEVGEISNKVQEIVDRNVITMYVMRTEDEYVSKRAVVMGVLGRRKEIMIQVFVTQWGILEIYGSALRKCTAHHYDGVGWECPLSRKKALHTT